MKKIVSLVLCAVMLISTLATTVGAAQYNPEELDEDNLSLTQTIMKDETFSLGDVNSDGSFNAADSLTLKLDLSGAAANQVLFEAADFDADGKLTAMDSYSMKTCLAGKKSLADFGGDKQLYNFTIGGVSISDFSIVIPEDASYDSNLYFATELIYEYVKYATGYALPIERGTASGANAIYVNSVADESELGQELGHEGYKYEVKDGSLYIYGTHRGCMYAAYEIIEEYLGFNFLIGTHTFSYKQRSVDIEEGTEKTFVPPFRFRHTKSTFPSGNREAGYLARRLNGTQSYAYKNEKRSVEYYGDFVGPVFNNIHSYAYYWQMGTGIIDVYEDSTEDEYFARLQTGEVKSETEWEPCATSEKDYNTLFTGFLYTIRMIEARGYPIKYQDKTNCYSFSINDNANWCTCRKCNAEIKKKTGTGLYLELANKGARDIQAYYPGLDVLSWTYTREMPIDVLPDEHLVVVLAGFNCANHYLGSDECERGTFFGFPNSDFEERIDQWDDLCEQTGAEIWLWYYPESHYFWFVDIPNFYTIFYDIKWCFEHGVDGFFYEGSGGKGYLFENVKAYLASKVMFDPSMTLEEYEEALKSYLYSCYGRGWENIYQLIQMYEEAGNAVGFEGGNQNSSYCYIGNYDRAYDLVSVVYMNENYETMRNLILAAIEEHDESLTTNSGYTTTKLNNLFYAFEILGLGATYLDHYVNGTEEQRAEYKKRADSFLEYYLNTGMTVSSYTEYHAKVPEVFDLDAGNPAYYFFPGGSRRSVVIELLGPEPAME
ncbi:MAG: DUF4838 domain-containing protein [Clostridia bacterium]|nr:DUF4838 domain-containing protein [Clostridia bacterium]